MTKKLYDRIPKGIKTKWVKALLSGKFEQTQNVLKRQVGVEVGLHQFKYHFSYCCLGVISELKKVPNDLDSSSPQFSLDFTFKGFPPRNGKYGPAVYISDVEPPAGFCDLNANAIRKLASMNDSGKSFKQIAAWIERYL